LLAAGFQVFYHCLRLLVSVPLERHDHSVKILPYKGSYRCERIGACLGVEIERASDKVLCRIGQKELISRSSGAFHIKYDTIHLVFRAVNLEFFDVAGLYIVFIGHFKGIFHQFIEVSPVSDGVIAAIYPGIQRPDINVEPAIALGIFVKKCGIVFDGGVNRLIERELAVFFIKLFICFFRINDPGVGAFFRNGCEIVASK